MSAKFLLTLILPLPLLAACGPGPTGKLTLNASGEAGAVDGFPFTEDGETVAIADGWEVRFSKVIASIGHVTLADSSGAEGLHDASFHVVDLHKAESVALKTYEDVPAQRWDKVSFRVAPPEGTPVNVNGVDAADLSALVDGGGALLVEGTATKGEAGLSFRWVLPVNATYADCTNGVDGTSGLVVPANTTAESTITLHMEHLFWTSLGTEESELSFGAIAGKATGGAISFDALATQSLEQPTDAEGNPVKDSSGANLIYNPDSATPSPSNLKEFIVESATRMPHLDGEGLCTITRN